jgi:plasmid stability protein
VGSDFPGRPKHLKGALLAFQSQLIPGVPRVIVFQYNPDGLNRRLSHRTATGGPDRRAEARDVLQVGGPPEEHISMTVTLDAADQLEFPAENPDVVGAGLHPALATLELLLYPRSEVVLANFARAMLGSRSITRTDAPMAVLVWGPARVVPVRIGSFSITEQAFDQALNPIRAEVSLEMQVLTYRELEPGTIAHGLSVAHHIAKEVLSGVHQAKTVVTAVGQLPF